MITSALIMECRREFGDNKKSTKVSKEGDGSTTLFNTGVFPIIESSYSIYKGTSAQVETSNYTLDLDTGDLNFVTAPAVGIQAIGHFKYAHWRDKNWNEAINNSIQELNARGFFRQVVRNSSIFKISANVTVYSAPSACIDLYELLESADHTSAGNRQKLYTNWSYQQDGNKIILGGKPSLANFASISYLRNLQTYDATSATLDVLNDWVVLVKKKAGAQFFRSLAAKVAKEANANIDEGHFSFTNLRTMAADLEKEFGELALRKKPTRPAKDMQFRQEGGGVA